MNIARLTALSLATVALFRASDAAAAVPYFPAGLQLNTPFKRVAEICPGLYVSKTADGFVAQARGCDGLGFGPLERVVFTFDGEGRLRDLVATARASTGTGVFAIRDQWKADLVAKGFGRADTGFNAFLPFADASVVLTSRLNGSSEAPGGLAIAGFLGKVDEGVALSDAIADRAVPAVPLDAVRCGANEVYLALECHSSASAAARRAELEVIADPRAKYLLTTIGPGGASAKALTTGIKAKLKALETLTKPLELEGSCKSSVAGDGYYDLAAQLLAAPTPVGLTLAERVAYQQHIEGTVHALLERSQTDYTLDVATEGSCSVHAKAMRDRLTTALNPK